MLHEKKKKESNSQVRLANTAKLPLIHFLLKIHSPNNILEALRIPIGKRKSMTSHCLT